MKLSTLITIDFKRALRDSGTVFVLGIPLLMFIIFGTTTSYAEYPFGNGNVAMMTMINMALYGATSVTVALASNAAVERMQGWGRQIALTPLRDSQYILVKVVVAGAFALLPMLAIYFTGFVTTSEAPARVWALSFALILAGALVMALYGLFFGLALKSDSGTTIATGTLVVLSFLGNLFVPLSGTMLTISKFTPLYGLGVIARWPLAEGANVGMDGKAVQESLTLAIANLSVWTLVLAAASLWAFKRSRSR
ncbi:ABC-2 type transport system permease protein [Arcanobacterium pluranimalium]|uniref:ABC transporter permease n=1 Tax=Arcanobacterium pluranimalium TaxID=108028 RepID=UPI00195DEBF8|nr:ABC transporter permease [Arcanobacterium pluranimalium]MBM7824738.1 ABC-2 type transport system permease protein [Arcanobacterium pluranimalium]